MTAELRAISGSITSHVPHRLEGSRGFWRSVVGDGKATFKANTTSGSLRILAAQPGDHIVAAAAPAAPAVPVAPAAPGAHAAPGSPTEPPAAATVDSSGHAGFESSPAAEDTERRETEETWNPDETGEAEQAGPDPEELAVLQALERGEIGVDEAAERLDRSRR